MLKTQCENCSFSSVGSCTLGFDTEIVSGQSYRNGFCRFKRSQPHTTNRVKLQECKNHLIIVDDSTNLEYAYSVLGKMDYLSTYVDSVSFSILDNKNTSSKFKCAVFDKLLKIPWTLLLTKDEYKDENKFFMMHSAGMRLESGMFYCYDSSTSPKDSDFCHNDPEDNKLVTYHSENDYINISGNVRLFKEMSGNATEPFFLKIQTAQDDWKNLCKWKTR